MKFIGTWYIYEMEMRDEDYFNMETQAVIKVERSGLGFFNFGVVSGEIDGEVVKNDNAERFEFTWEGNCECDPASGMGWIKLIDDNTIEGKIKFHLGDSSMFKAKRVK